MKQAAMGFRAHRLWEGLGWTTGCDWVNPAGATKAQSQHVQPDSETTRPVSQGFTAEPRNGSQVTHTCWEHANRSGSHEPPHGWVTALNACPCPQSHCDGVTSGLRLAFPGALPVVPDLFCLFPHPCHPRRARTSTKLTHGHSCSVDFWDLDRPTPRGSWSQLMPEASRQKQG